MYCQFDRFRVDGLEMNLLLNSFIIVALYIQLCDSYIYPILCEKCLHKEDASFTKYGNEEESEFVRDIMNNIILPINNGLCNLWVSFLEVYDCVAHQYGSKDGAAGSGKEKSLFQRFWALFGFYNKEEHVSKCSYYSIMIVTSSLLLLMALLYSTKKMVDYFREEDFLDIGYGHLRKGSLNRKLNICNCKLNDAL